MGEAARQESPEGQGRARWTKKNDESFYGYKNHVGVDKAHVASAMPIISATSLTDLP
jgi:hypothetical protein